MATVPKPAMMPGPAIDPELKEFIDSAIVPALVKDWLTENRRENPLASTSNDMDNAARSTLISDKTLSAEEGVTL